MLDMFKEFWQKLTNANRLCRDCMGRGKWQEENTYSDGMTTIETKYCETCRGMGFITNDDDTDDFDLAGIGTTEFDEDED